MDFGNYSQRKFDAAVNIPFSPTVAMRIAGQTVDHEGYLSDGTDDEKSRAGRAQLKLTPTDSLSILLSGDVTHIGGVGPGAVTLTPGGFAMPADDDIVTACLVAHEGQVTRKA